MYILFTLRTMFKCPFGFGLLFVNNLLRVWYIIPIFSVFDFIGMLHVRGRDFRRPMVPVTFCVFIYRNLVRFVSFMGPSTLLPSLSYRFAISVGFL